MILSDILSVLSPAYCRGCGKLLVTGEQFLCVNCREKLEETNFHLQAENLFTQRLTEECEVFAATALFYFKKDNMKVSVVPVYGAGLWGPVWGYMAFDEDMKTIIGAYFDHESETPGLGAKIKDDPNFRAEFIGKIADFSSNVIFSIVKGGAAADQSNAIDAITGATMTSKGLGDAINTWLKSYKPFFTKMGSVEKTEE